MSKLCAILQIVEELRGQLHQELKARAMSDPEVIALSQKLDQALNTYQSIITPKRDKQIEGLSKNMTKE